MADQIAAQPVRSDIVTEPIVVSRTLNQNSASNVLFVQLSDGTTTVGVTSGALDVNIASGGAANIFVDDSAFTVSTDSVAAIGFLADETASDSVDEGDIGIPRMTLDRKQLTRIVGSTDADRWEIDSSGFGQMDIAAVSVTAVPVSADANANAETNPIFVQVVSGAVSGIEVVDFNTAAAVAKDATSNHDITVTAASTMKVQCILVSASGAAKWEVQSGPVLTLVTEAVNFTSASNQNSVFDFKGLLEVPDTSTGTVRIIRTNRDNQAQDVYSTLIATEV